MPPHISIRPIQPTDFAACKPLWDAYNAFYGREGATALPNQITQATWQRFFDEDEPVHAFVASVQTPEGEQLVGLVHYLFHRSTTRLNHVCYLQDLIVAPQHCGQRIAAALIEAVYAAAAERPDGSPWQRVPRFLAGWMGSQGDGNPPKNPSVVKVENSMKEFLHEKEQIHRQPDHGCIEAG